MYPTIDTDLDAMIQGLDPEVGSNLPDEILSDEVDSQIEPQGDVQEAQIEEESDEVPEEVKEALKTLIDNFDKQEQPVRDRMTRIWKRGELFWRGIQDIYWDWTARDYRRLNDDSSSGNVNNELDYYYQDKIINIYRAHGESVASALTQEIPSIIFPPDDADNPDDVQTSKGYTKASELLAKCNNAEQLLMRAIFLLWNQGLIGAYNYNLASEEFGTYPEKQYKDVETVQKELACPNCGGPVQEEAGITVCPACEMEVEPVEVGEIPTVESIEVGEIEKPKKREKIELYGPLHFRIPHYVTSAKFTPYVMLDTECHVDYVRELYPTFEVSEEHDLEKFDRWARINVDYQGELTQGLVTLRRVWLRPWTFNAFKKDNEEVYNFLKQHYPDGAKVTLVNDKIAKCESEELDKHWTFSENPLSSHLHADPIGAPLMPIQEMRNELVVLKLQTIEYGIPETFADSTVFDFEEYNKQKASPGKIYPVKGQAGQSIESAFATLKTATFPKEAVEFQHELDADGQFVVGSFPSIYGGSMPSASKTAAEYQMSRNQALQRLQNTWKIVTKFWSKVMDKSTRSFIANLTEDERTVSRNGNSYINVYIRQSEMTGRVGSAEPEVAQTFPMSWMQKRDMLIQLMQLNNEYINEALFSSDNRGMLAQYLGLPEFNIPGDDARNKQLLEIQEMLIAEPMEEFDPMTEEPMIQPTLPVDEIMDNHQVEYETIVSWMNSEIGLDAKKTNPAGWMNVRMHGEQHYFYLQQMLASEQESEQESNQNKGSKNEKPKENIQEMD